MRPVKKPFVRGDLVLVAFPGCGYWPCQITAVLKHGRREVKCFGEDSTGNAFPKNMVHYNKITKAKYISKSTFKTYPHLAEALKQIETYKENAVNKTMENKKSKQKNRGTKEILEESVIENCNKIDTFAKTAIRCQNQNVEEAALGVEEPVDMIEGDDSEMTCIGVSGSVGFIKRMALGDKEMALSVKNESGSAMENGQPEEVIKREIGDQGTEEDTNVDETGTGSDDEFDLKIKVELDSEVDDFGSSEMEAIEAENQNNTNTNVDSSESTNGMSNASAASHEDDSVSKAEEEPCIEPRASSGNEADKETGVPKSSDLDPDVQPPFSSPQGGDPENDNEIVKITVACEMPRNVFTRFAPMLMEAVSLSKTPPAVNIHQK